MARIGFIGAGKVACSMGRYLSEHGITVSGYYDVSADSADEAATFTDSQVFLCEADVIAASEIIFIATPDDVIISVWNRIRTMDIRDRIIGMFSGSLSSRIFSGIGTTGAHGVSVHPMYAFSDKFSDYHQLHTARLTMEGDPFAVQELRSLFEELGHTVSVIDSDKKFRYHAAASVASNLMVGLYEMSLSMLTDCGFSEADAGDFLSPLIEKNVAAMTESGPVAALTGPIERGDAETVRHHLEAMTREEREVYLPLAGRLVAISEKKNPERDYREIREVLKLQSYGDSSR